MTASEFELQVRREWTKGTAGTTGPDTAGTVRPLAMVATLRTIVERGTRTDVAAEVATVEATPAMEEGVQAGSRETARTLEGEAAGEGEDLTAEEEEAAGEAEAGRPFPPTIRPTSLRIFKPQMIKTKVCGSSFFEKMKFFNIELNFFEKCNLFVNFVCSQLHSSE